MCVRVCVWQGAPGAGVVACLLLFMVCIVIVFLFYKTSSSVLMSCVL